MPSFELQPLWGLRGFCRSCRVLLPVQEKHKLIKHWVRDAGCSSFPATRKACVSDVQENSREKRSRSDAVLGAANSYIDTLPALKDGACRALGQPRQGALWGGMIFCSTVLTASQQCCAILCSTLLQRCQNRMSIVAESIACTRLFFGLAGSGPGTGFAIAEADNDGLSAEPVLSGRRLQNRNWR